MIERLLKTWRKQIPDMECEPGCRECCEGDARAMTKWEWLQLTHPGKYSDGRVFKTCPFLGEAGCAIYARRPLICRLFGTVSREEMEELDLVGIIPISCPQGCEPERPLPLAQALKIQVDYQSFANRELQRVIEDWGKYLSSMAQANHSRGRLCHNGESQPGAAVPQLPDKFQWLRYVLSTREGQATVRLLSGAAPVNIDAAKMAKMAAIIGD